MYILSHFIFLDFLFEKVILACFLFWCSLISIILLIIHFEYLVLLAQDFQSKPRDFLRRNFACNVWSWSSHLLVILLQLQHALNEVPLTSLFHSNRLHIEGKEVQNDQGMASQWFQNHGIVHITLQWLAWSGDSLDLLLFRCHFPAVTRKQNWWSGQMKQNAKS